MTSIVTVQNAPREPVPEGYADVPCAGDAPNPGTEPRKPCIGDPIVTTQDLTVAEPTPTPTPTPEFFPRRDPLPRRDPDPDPDLGCCTIIPPTPDVPAAVPLPAAGTLLALAVIVLMCRARSNT